MSKLLKQKKYKRPLFKLLKKRAVEAVRYIQVLVGARQTGKTTLALQLSESLKIPTHYASADAPGLKEKVWIEQQWARARWLITGKTRRKKAVLVLDEIQKIPGWSDTIKGLWDEDRRNNTQLVVFILGSSTLLVKKGLSESLAGRFEVIFVPHWSFSEMKAAFCWNLDRYLFFGGYPGAAPIVDNERRWSNYILNSLIEPAISRDVLLMQRVDKPALLRRVFELSCLYSGQILSYQKMLGQLTDAGNTVTLAGYLKLLNTAGMVKGLEKIAMQKFRQRSSSPKLQVYNTALLSSLSGKAFKEAVSDFQFWGQLTESCVGAHLVNGILGSDYNLFYWRHRNREVDFVLKRGEGLLAIEVKSHQKKVSLPGLKEFSKQFPNTEKLLVGGGGIPIEEFLTIPPTEFMR
ncbi:ATP-binding protein [Candidatus Riflebacteria bacterium]